MSRQHIHLEAVVLKRTNYGDADRFVTLFSDQRGKISGLAKGVRKLTSRKRIALEPLNKVKVSVLETRSGYLLTEAVLLESHPQIKETLPRLTQALQLAEVIESLIAEDEHHPNLYAQFAYTLERLNSQHATREEILEFVKYSLDELGFGVPSQAEDSLKLHIESITQKPLRSKQFFLGY